MTTRVLSPAVAGSPLTYNGVTYSAPPGTAVDYPDNIAQLLAGNGWTVICPSGPTSARPVYPTLDRSGQAGAYAQPKGAEFLDVTLGKVIRHDGLVWRDPVTGNAV